MMRKEISSRVAHNRGRGGGRSNSSLRGRGWERSATGGGRGDRGMGLMGVRTTTFKEGGSKKGRGIHD